MTALTRNKDNADVADLYEGGTVPKFLRRYIITKPEDIETCYEEVERLMGNVGLQYRIYISLNARDAVMATINFQTNLLDVSIGLAKGQPDALVLSKKIGSLWKTELAQQRNRGTKRVLLDLDNCKSEQAQNVLLFMKDSKMKTTVHAYQPTVSGFHIVFDACDTRDLMDFCKGYGVEADLQRDSMVFVGRW